MMLYVMIVIKWTISGVNTIGTEFGMLNRRVKFRTDKRNVLNHLKSHPFQSKHFKHVPSPSSLN